MKFFNSAALFLASVSVVAGENLRERELNVYDTCGYKELVFHNTEPRESEEWCAVSGYGTYESPFQVCIDDPKSYENLSLGIQATFDDDYCPEKVTFCLYKKDEPEWKPYGDCRTERNAKWSAFANRGDDFYGERLPEGEYKLILTTEKNGYSTDKTFYLKLDKFEGDPCGKTCPTPSPTPEPTPYPTPEPTPYPTPDCTPKFIIHDPDKDSKPCDNQKIGYIDGSDDYFSTSCNNRDYDPRYGFTVEYPYGCDPGCVEIILKDYYGNQVKVNDRECTAPLALDGNRGCDIYGGDSLPDGKYTLKVIPTYLPTEYSYEFELKGCMPED